jgi:hypothetical protein
MLFQDITEEGSSGNGIYVGPIPSITELERSLFSFQTLSGCSPIGTGEA